MNGRDQTGIIVMKSHNEEYTFNSFSYSKFYEGNNPIMELKGLFKKTVHIISLHYSIVLQGTM